jgi:hypothetical protein
VQGNVYDHHSKRLFFSRNLLGCKEWGVEAINPAGDFQRYGSKEVLFD